MHAGLMQVINLCGIKEWGKSQSGRMTRVLLGEANRHCHPGLDPGSIHRRGTDFNNDALFQNAGVPGFRTKSGMTVFDLSLAKYPKLILFLNITIYRLSTSSHEPYKKHYC